MDPGSDLAAFNALLKVCTKHSASPFMAGWKGADRMFHSVLLQEHLKFSGCKLRSIISYKLFR